MTLPQLASLEECADFHKAVEPFLPQLYALPQLLLDNISNKDALLQIYLETNPLISAGAASLFLGFLFLVFSEINRNYSQVDRAWSLLPALYIAHMAVWARFAGVSHDRIDLAAVFAALWSMRLTFNYWRKGGYSVGSEDYRWAIIKERMHPIAFFLLNLFFISFGQSFLLFLFSGIPSYTLLLAGTLEKDVTSVDWAFFSLGVSLVFSEWVSDGQQWKYQTAKHQYQNDAKLPKGFQQIDLDRGFITSGLWAYSRHPNCAAEQMIWFCLYQWSCIASNVLYSWVFIGSGSLIMLFQGSTFLTEAISSSKYTEYAGYKKQVGMFLPKSFRPFKATAGNPKATGTSALAKKQGKKQQ